MPGSRRAHGARPVRHAGGRGTVPGHAREAERHLGRVEWLRGRPYFVPSRRVRHGRRPLVSPEGLDPAPGDYVIAEVPDDVDEAYLVERIGADDDPRYDDLAVASRHRLERVFPREAETEARTFAAPALDPASGRLDLTDRAAFTMDPADAQDFDDALSWKPLPGGGCEVGIHVADVAYYVRPGSALDAAARSRATSVYLAQGAIPMLPHALSSDLCSLRPHVPRFTQSVLVEMDARGGIVRYRIAEGLIRSRARLAYEDGQRALDGDPAARAGIDPEVVRSLERLGAIAERLRARRLERGALDLDIPEAKAYVDAQGNTIRMERRPRLFTMSVVEEFMLLANLLVGEEAERREGPFLYRVHEAPALAKLAQLDAMLAAVGLPRLGGSEGVSQALQKLLAISLAPEKRRLLHQLVLRTLARAAYREVDVGHFGLGVRGYCHFTSPIRRYPDLFNHRQVKGWLDATTGAPVPALDPDAGDLHALALHTSGREQGAQEAERESTRVKALRFMEERVGDEFQGTITGVVSPGVFVELDDIPVDGFLKVSSYVDDEFRMDDAGVRLMGRRTRRRFGLGDRLPIRIARVDVPARELELALEPSHAGRARGSRRHAQHTSARRSKDRGRERRARRKGRG
ncbi:MAG: ribonuclease R family protein [Candidatus Eiseniibacteriota bacterium]